MLSHMEKQGCNSLLQLLPDEELRSLAQTVTARQLTLTNRKESIEAILTYTQDALEFLKRKKVKRDYLFRYIAQNNLAVSPTSEKCQLITAILQYWNPGYERKEIPLPRNAGNEICDDLPSSSPCTRASNQVSSPENAPGTTEEQALAFAFAQWFFQLLNAQNPSSGIVTNETFGTQHFYSDCQLKMISATSELTKDDFSGSELTVKRLLALAMEERLIFSPNLSEQGVRGMSEAHGLNVVLVCGIIHQHSNPVGIFEQQFGLVREPLTQRWKIKYVNLKIGAGVLDTKPTLQDTKERLPIDSS